MEIKREYIVSFKYLFIVLAVFLVLYYGGKGISGLAAFNPQSSEVINVDQEFNEDGNFEAFLGKDVNIKGLKINGNYKGQGSFKVFLEIGNLSILVMDSAKSENKNVSRGLLTGFAVADVKSVSTEDTKTQTDANSDNKNGENTLTSGNTNTQTDANTNEEKTLTSGDTKTQTDANTNGEKTLTSGNTNTQTDVNTNEEKTLTSGDTNTQTDVNTNEENTQTSGDTNTQTDVNTNEENTQSTEENTTNVKADLNDNTEVNNTNEENTHTSGSTNTQTNAKLNNTNEENSQTTEENNTQKDLNINVINDTTEKNATKEINVQTNNNSNNEIFNNETTTNNATEEDTTKNNVQINNSTNNETNTTLENLTANNNTEVLNSTSVASTNSSNNNNGNLIENQNKTNNNKTLNIENETTSKMNTFSNECLESCDLDINANKIKLRIEINGNLSLHISSLTYFTPESDVQKAPILFKEIPDLTLKDKNTAKIKLLDYFNGENLNFGVDASSKLIVNIINGTAYIRAKELFSDKKHITFYAANGYGSAESNSINVKVIDSQKELLLKRIYELFPAVKVLEAFKNNNLYSFVLQLNETTLKIAGIKNVTDIKNITTGEIKQEITI